MRQSSSALLNIAAAEQMLSLGRALGSGLRSATAGALVIGIEGELGAGKTTLVSGVLAALGIAGPIRSPTYTLIEPYEADGLHLYHIDLYRLASAAEVDGLALRDLLHPGAVLLIEWPSRAQERLPQPDLTLRIEYPSSIEQGRLVALTAGSSAGDKLVEQILAAESQ